ncbi:MAG: toll/interleukin-1 receptor domain-containing protein [Deltaproteobacteria bacterium]|nr:toll/interleukin-1 receptor domain-containing protein [Deltaproteobacteria bacterium]
MKIFISYSTDDLNIVRSISNYIKQNSIVFYWDNNRIPGNEAWPTIFNWIDQSDLVLAILTDKTISRAMSVGQEIGRAKAQGKTIIPIVSSNVQFSELGFLNGVTCLKIERDNPGPVFKELERIVLAKRQQKETQQLILLLSGIIGMIWLASNNK